MGENGNSIFNSFSNSCRAVVFPPQRRRRRETTAPAALGSWEERKGGRKNLFCKHRPRSFLFLGGEGSRKMSPTTKKRGTDKGRRRDRFPIFAPPPLFRSLFPHFLGGFKKDKERSFRTSFTFSAICPQPPIPSPFISNICVGKQNSCANLWAGGGAGDGVEIVWGSAFLLCSCFCGGVKMSHVEGELEGLLLSACLQHTLPFCRTNSLITQGGKGG